MRNRGIKRQSVPSSFARGARGERGHRRPTPNVNDSDRDIGGRTGPRLKMIDISEKIETLRTAVAESKIRAREETIRRALAGDTPKGEVLPVARAAGVLAAKKTAELIPYCHPLLLDSVHIEFEVRDSNSPQPTLKLRGGEPRRGEGELSEMVIRVEVKSIGKTGVEMEALTAASVTALTVYDMLKGIDKEVVISETRLLEKHGGKSDFQETFLKPISAAVLVTSDGVSQGKKSDKSGKIIAEEMKKFPVEVCHYEIVPDDKTIIRQKLMEWVEGGIRLILITGGTGLGPRDVTADLVREIADREVPGIAEAMRSYGQRRTPYAMLSRSVVGVKGRTLIITFPGSSNGVRESLAAIFPNVLHGFNMMSGGGHESAKFKV